MTVQRYTVRVAKYMSYLYVVCGFVCLGFDICFAVLLALF